MRLSTTASTTKPYIVSQVWARRVSAMTTCSGVVTSLRVVTSPSWSSSPSRLSRSSNPSTSSKRRSSGIGIRVNRSNGLPRIRTSARFVGSAVRNSWSRRSGYFSSDRVSPVGAQSTTRMS